MDSMDIDIDLDEEIDPEIQRLRAEADAINKVRGQLNISERRRANRWCSELMMPKPTRRTEWKR